jgi:TolA-binding protein
MPETPSHHEGEQRQSLLIETEAGATVDKLSVAALVMGIATLAKEHGANANFVTQESARNRIRECGESIVAAQQELSRRFSAMQERINNLETEIASLKGNE